MGAFDSEEFPFSAEHRARKLATDPEALLARLDAPIPEEGLVDGLRELRAPCLLYVGDRDDFHDGAMRIAAEMPDCEFVSLPGLGHRGVEASSGLVLSHVAPLLERVESGA